MIDETNKGRRVELIFTDDKRTDLKPGAKGTYQYANVSDSHTCQPSTQSYGTRGRG